jgi:hypothetical protein
MFNNLHNSFQKASNDPGKQSISWTEPNFTTQRLPSILNEPSGTEKIGIPKFLSSSSISTTKASTVNPKTIEIENSYLYVSNYFHILDDSHVPYYEEPSNIDLLEQSINALECTAKKKLDILEKSIEVAMGTNEVATCALDKSIHLYKEATDIKVRSISSELTDVKDDTRLLLLKFSELHRNIAANDSADRSKI